MVRGKRAAVGFPASATRLFGEARSMSVAVTSKHGPHVTPELFVVVDDKLWSLTSATSLKVRTLRRHRRAGLLVRSGDSSVVMAASATVLDIARPLDALRSRAALHVPLVLAAFATRHAVEIAGGAADLAAGRFGLVPDRWVLLSFDVDALAVARGAEVLAAWGWADRRGDDDVVGDDGEDAGSAELAVSLDDLPPPVRGLPSRPHAALGWNALVGPVALPATWALDEVAASVPASVWSTVGCRPRSRAAVTFDEWVAPGPTGKRGVMLRGAGRASIVDDDVRVTLAPERAVVWDGVDTSSVAGIRDSSRDPDHTADIRDPNKDPKKESRAG